MRRSAPQLRWLLPLVVLLAAVLGACQGCRNSAADPNHGAETPLDRPSVRLYLVSTLAGALEPCGCSKDQLGGVDHLAAFIHKDKAGASAHAVLAAGPLFFIDPKLTERQASQDRFKADALADAVKSLGLAAWAPGFNDWAAGADALAELTDKSGAAALAAGIAGPGLTTRRLLTAGELKIGVVGLASPQDRLGRFPDGITPPADPKTVLEAEIAALKREGARLIVALTAMPRGQALRLAETEGLHVLLVGQPSSEGHGNTEQPPPELVGGTLVVETANHGQTVAVVDVFVRGDGELTLADAGGVKKAETLADLARRIRELEARLNSWEKGGKVDAKDLAARKADLEKLHAERAQLDKDGESPRGSFFRYRVEEVRERLGEDASVTQRMLAYYKQVNEHNKKAFANLLPPPAAEGEAAFVGVEECTTCHAEARAVWDKTPHAKAYATLVKDFKEYNLECVACHVTGYGKPGGSTVTHNEKLQDVQCEDCHGPGSLHVADPENPKLIQLAPDPQSCVSRCHHPPHVEGFDPVAKMDLILGPGHGK